VITLEAKADFSRSFYLSEMTNSLTR